MTDYSYYFVILMDILLMNLIRLLHNFFLIFVGQAKTCFGFVKFFTK